MSIYENPPALSLTEAPLIPEPFRPGIRQITFANRFMSNLPDRIRDLHDASGDMSATHTALQKIATEYLRLGPGYDLDARTIESIAKKENFDEAIRWLAEHISFTKATNLEKVPDLVADPKKQSLREHAEARYAAFDLAAKEYYALGPNQRAKFILIALAGGMFPVLVSLALRGLGNQLSTPIDGTIAGDLSRFLVGTTSLIGINILAHRRLHKAVVEKGHQKAVEAEDQRIAQKIMADRKGIMAALTLGDLAAKIGVIGVSVHNLSQSIGDRLAAVRSPSSPPMVDFAQARQIVDVPKINPPLSAADQIHNLHLPVPSHPLHPASPDFYPQTPPGPEPPSLPNLEVVVAQQIVDSGRTHLVGPNDTFTEIIEKYYGSGYGQEYLDMLALNRDTIIASLRDGIKVLRTDGTPYLITKEQATQLLDFVIKQNHAPNFIENFGKTQYANILNQIFQAGRLAARPGTELHLVRGILPGR
jgi:hypothetical protein